MSGQVPVAESLSRDEQSAPIRLGEPSERRLLGPIDGLAVIVSSLTLIAGYLAISSKLTLAWAWKLGMTNQIIIVGFLLSIQSLCLRRVMPLCWLVFEAKYGSSYLQNYDAILQNTALVRHTSLIWRCIIILFLSLPIALSVGYKQFANHLTFFDLGIQSLDWGLFAPPGLSDFCFNTGLYLMAIVIQPYMISAQSSEPFTRKMDHTAGMSYPGNGFGLNNLVLPNGTCAFLDVPAPDVINRIQDSLRPTETQYLHATVNAIITTHSTNPHEVAPWNPDAVPEYSPLNDDFNLGMLILDRNRGDSSWSQLAISRSPRTMGNFRDAAQTFYTHRKKCDGWWSITATSVRIEGGNCGDEYANQEYFNSTRFRSWSTVYMQFLSELLGGYIENKDYQEHVVPVMTNAIAAMYWSRFVVMDGPESGRQNITGSLPRSISAAQCNDSFYSLRVQVLSSVQTLEDGYPLYTIIGLQPLLLLLALLFIMCMSHVPIDHGFGLASFLSAVDPSTITKLDGSSLSGTLSRKVPVKITVEHRTSSIDGFRSEFKNNFVHRYSSKFNNDFQNEIQTSLGEMHGFVRIEIDEPKTPMTKESLLQRGVFYR